ncbi:serine hydrolase [Aquimarina sp. U1-2]|uniref:serine hydrolase n=1 Tax=Aquimarina sp. U1-2 TaxID=2823141 RepID=UPI001AEC774F|nr:serine hydrolase [Aquimarina sp. U1-2]MBP2832990.1 serine hydrolase [Aquimarina sp. U1-2]
MSTKYVVVVLLMIVSCTTQNPLEQVLQSKEDAIRNIMQSYKNYEVQILYTQIDRNTQGNVSFTDFEFNVNDSIYFYPASSVKFPIALLALGKLKELQEKGVRIDRKTNFKTQNDTYHSSIEKSIIDIFAISDNQAYNRLFEFLGQDYINQNLHSKQLKGNISHRLSIPNSRSLTTASIMFKKHLDDSIPVYKQYPIKNKALPKLSLKNTSKGKGYFQNDSLIKHPKDFSKKNYLPLRSLHSMMKRIHFPDSYKKSDQFDMNPADRTFILKAMQNLPHQAGFDKTIYYDSYVKFFIFGDHKRGIPDHIKMYNKVGYAYGYLTDCAYIIDTKNNLEFILSATVHVNKNEIYNDDQYEYDTIGIPFLAELGRQIYTFELNRK